MGRVTLQTIAEELGVSRTTVSNAYSRPNQLTPALRERILETAARLGYGGPDAAARTLRKGQAGAIGLLFTEPLGFVLSDEFAVSFLHGVAETAEEHHVGVVLTSVQGGDKGLDTVKNAVVDGFCIYCCADDTRATDVIRQRNLPIVHTYQVSDADASYAAIDDHQAAAAAAQHLLDLGHDRIAVIADCGLPPGHLGPLDRAAIEAYPESDSRSRLAGYLDAYTAAGLDPQALQFVYASSNTMGAGNAAMAHLLEQMPWPTGVLAGTDVLALGALTALDVHGLTPGREISVVGLDDIPRASQAGLTTIRQPGRQKGRTAASLLLDPPADPDERRVVLPTELVARESTGPPPGLDLRS
ncbi:MAG: LacI family DNA-binding transcriptional regulator [Streptosporangiales bacterium]|nr:LacI family DNA-binding transcriptional regulator [Streptosporangiales bacterium]